MSKFLDFLLEIILFTPAIVCLIFELTRDFNFLNLYIVTVVVLLLFACAVFNMRICKLEEKIKKLEGHK
jgi:hypothetical protein